MIPSVAPCGGARGRPQICASEPNARGHKNAHGGDRQAPMRGAAQRQKAPRIGGIGRARGRAAYRAAHIGPGGMPAFGRPVSGSRAKCTVRCVTTRVSSGTAKISRTAVS